MPLFGPAESPNLRAFGRAESPAYVALFPQASVNLIRSLTLTNQIHLWALVLLVVCVTVGCEQSPTGDWKPKTATVLPTIQRVDAIELQLTRNAFQTTSFMGTLKPRRSTPLAFTQGGRVAKIEITSGQQVTAEQVLAQIDVSDLETQKATVQTALETARQQLDANQNSSALRTQVADLQRNLDEIDREIANATIKAPFAGVVTKRTVEQGQVVSAGMPVFDLVDTGNLIVEVKVATAIANGMNPGAEVWILIQGQPFKAVITTVLPTTEGSTRTRTVTLSFRDDQPSQMLNPGDAVEVSYWTQTGNSGFWLPYSVLQQQTTGLWSALIAQEEANGTYARARTLDVVQLHDELALVQGALNPGDRVIINGLNRIVAGQKVQATLVENTMVIPSPVAMATTDAVGADSSVPSDLGSSDLESSVGADGSGGSSGPSGTLP